ncbi:hypothetical protein EI94DRAFT_561683 [Lactarius quietus]|nr:hypothetical protein EI94DRAFT_561683 [Lactarius quietus]
MVAIMTTARRLQRSRLGNNDDGCDCGNDGDNALHSFCSSGILLCCTPRTKTIDFLYCIPFSLQGKPRLVLKLWPEAVSTESPPLRHEFLKAEARQKCGIQDVPGKPLPACSFNRTWSAGFGCHSNQNRTFRNLRHISFGRPVITLVTYCSTIPGADGGGSDGFFRGSGP